MDLDPFRSINHFGASCPPCLITGKDNGCTVLAEETFEVMKNATARCHTAACNNYVRVGLISQRLGVLGAAAIMNGAAHFVAF